MGISQITQEIVAYTNSWKESKKKKIKNKEKEEEIFIFLLNYSKKERGEFFSFFKNPP